ncbi:MAG: ParM/StbA family protein [Cyanobacteriota bacterium]|nr:ParM/StbA family protein [Cyanobacteriota bacterium]
MITNDEIPTTTQTQNIDTTARVFLAADFGGIGTKAFYVSSESQKVKSIFMGPEIAEVDTESLNRFQESSITENNAEYRAWCGFQGSYRAVGALAENYFSASSLLKPLKYEQAIFKVLALLWVIKVKCNLPSNFRISLSLLIPPGEYDDRSVLEKILRQTSVAFDTPSGVMSVEMDEFDCQPEGKGILVGLSKVPGLAIKTDTVSLVMIGYRNASLIVLRKGEAIKKITSDLGMNTMVNLVKSRSSQNTPLSTLVPAIVEAGNDAKAEALTYLIRTSFVALKEHELHQLQEAILSSRKEYSSILLTWINENVPLSKQWIAYCGGTAQYLRLELDDFAVKQGWDTIWHGGNIKIPSELDPLQLKMRLNDIFIYFNGSRKKWEKYLNS